MPEASKCCAVVDPAFEVDRLLREAKQRGWTITARPGDPHPSRSRRWRRGDGAATGATVYVGAGEVAALQRAAPSAQIVGLAGGETIAVGELEIAALPTPGHTVAGTSYLVEGNVFTGDTLFVGGCGRTDFPGGDAPTLWRSLQRLAALPEETRVYPGTRLRTRRRRRPSAGRRRPIRICCARARRSSSRCAPGRTRHGPRSARNDALAQRPSSALERVLHAGLEGRAVDALGADAKQRRQHLDHDVVVIVDESSDARRAGALARHAAAARPAARRRRRR